MLIAMSFNATDNIAQIIQLSVAPVFLLAAVGTFLVVLTSRLARVVDRSRALDADIAAGHAPFGDATFHVTELRILDQRMTWINRAITLATFTNLFVCLLIIVLFSGELLTIDLSRVIAVMFIAAMAALVGAMVAFLVEISFARKMLRVRPELLASRAPLN
jgi:Protein of unknown function (DUF2721)